MMLWLCLIVSICPVISATIDDNWSTYKSTHTHTERPQLTYSTSILTPNTKQVVQGLHTYMYDIHEH